MLANQSRAHLGASARAGRPAAPLAMRLRLTSSSSSSLRSSRSLVARAAKLDEVPLFASNDSLMSGPSPTTSSAGGAAAGAAAAPKTAAEKINAVVLNSEVRERRRCCRRRFRALPSSSLSKRPLIQPQPPHPDHHHRHHHHKNTQSKQCGMDYAPLRDALLAADFRTADDETRALLIKLAGPAAVKRGWVYFTEVAPIPQADLATVDDLWRAASGNKFGFTVQREMFAQAQRRWTKFFQQIGWVQGENNVYLKWPAEFIYSLDAPKGHLPLTNALRGTQLFEALLGHPAFQRSSGGVSGGGGGLSLGLGGGGGSSNGSSSNGSSNGSSSSGGGGKGLSIDERARLAGQNTLNF